VVKESTAQLRAANKSERAGKHAEASRFIVTHVSDNVGRRQKEMKP
jgi:hypothetical protein